MSSFKEKPWKGKRSTPVTVLIILSKPHIIFCLYFVVFALVAVPTKGYQSLPRGIMVLQEGTGPCRGEAILDSYNFCVFSSYICCAFDHSSLVMLVHHICMSPALLCKSSVQSGNAEQCALAFIHLLSSSCTSYFYNISYMFVFIVNA